MTSTSKIPSSTLPVSSGRTALYGAVTLLSAFLLFQIQLIVAKYMLPWFGGTAAVWTTCIVFFQVLLLLGYGYTHATRKLHAKRRFELHAGLLGLSVAALAVAGVAWRSPITPTMAGLMSSGNPTLSVLTVLLVSAGLPFWLLSTTSPLLQDWFWRTEQRPPYRLYALSNLGSLAGLLTYPFVVEPRVTLYQQGWIWAWSYLVFGLGAVGCGWMAGRKPAAVPVTKKSKKRAAEEELPRGSVLMWVVLAATGSALMLGTTNFLTMDVASVPLLWVLPLSLYLLSFVLTFERESLYRRAVVYPLLGIGLGATCYVLTRGRIVPVRTELIAVNATLLFATIFCHGELARSKPSPAGLTRFYLWVAAGGALGSGFVALAAPRLFSGVWEFQSALGAVALLAVVVLFRDRQSWLWQAEAWKVAFAAALVGIAPTILGADILGQRTGDNTLHWALAGLALGAGTLFVVWRRAEWSWARPVAMALVCATPVLLGSILWEAAQFSMGNLVLRSRSFYGVLSLFRNYESEGDLSLYVLYHGRVLHGMQSLKPESRMRASSYYDTMSGVGQALLHHPRLQVEDGKQPMRVGVIGMGAGTLLVYARPNDTFRVYELNPDVLALSQGSNPYFTYLRDCAGTCTVVLGDGRTALQQEADAGQFQQFDVLVLDAFSGDAIPIHLLTLEAFRLYLRHLRDENSILAVHISNNALDLSPILARMAPELNMHAVRVQSPERGKLVRNSDWILLSHRNPPIDTLPAEARVARVTVPGPPGPLWTDEFSNLLSVIK